MSCALVPAVVCVDVAVVDPFLFLKYSVMTEVTWAWMVVVAQTRSQALLPYKIQQGGCVGVSVVTFRQVVEWVGRVFVSVSVVSFNNERFHTVNLPLRMFSVIA